MSFFHWPFAIAALLEIISLGFLVIGVLTLQADPKSRMRQLYMATCLCLMCWSSFYGYMTVAGSFVLAQQFWAVGFAACCMMFPFWLHFLLHIADIRLPHRPLWIAPFYAASAFLAVMAIASGGTEFVRTEFGNQFLYTGPWIRAALVFIMFEIAVFCVVQVYWWNSPKPKRLRRQASIFTVSTFVVAPVGLMLDFIFPGFLGINVPPLATVPMLVMALLLYRTLRVYKGLNVTVENAATIVFRNIRVPVLLLEPGNDVAMANGAAEDFWGISSGLKGRNMAQLFTVEREAPPQELFAADLDAQPVEVAAAQGGRLCEVQLIVVYDEYGEVFYKVAVFRDVTDMRDALERANCASRAKGEFLSNMSHEIRTPLNAITGMLQIAKKSIGTGNPTKALDSVDVAATASRHLLGVVNDVLDMSKIEAGKFEIFCEPFGLSAAVHEVSSIISQRCREQNLRFCHNLGALPDLWVYGDKLRIKQVLINVLGNSVKFTPRGGTVTMMVDAEEGEDGVRLAFTLSDNGIGMTADFLERVFDPFEQADTSGRSGGTGLGLPISKTLAEMMGGDLTVQSRPNEGSTFRFGVTLREAQAQAADVDIDMGQYDFSGLRLLLAEDVEVNRIILEELLADTGVDIEEAEDGRRALERFAASPVRYYSLILMDIQMPYMDGYEATQSIRALDRPDAETVPIIAMTANAYQEDVARALSAGMNGHLAKPVDLDATLRTLALYLNPPVTV